MGKFLGLRLTIVKVFSTDKLLDRYLLSSIEKHLFPIIIWLTTQLIYNLKPDIYFSKIFTQNYKLLTVVNFKVSRAGGSGSTTLSDPAQKSRIFTKKTWQIREKSVQIQRFESEVVVLAFTDCLLPFFFIRFVCRGSGFCGILSL